MNSQWRGRNLPYAQLYREERENVFRNRQQKYSTWRLSSKIIAKLVKKCMNHKADSTIKRKNWMHVLWYFITGSLTVCLIRWHICKKQQAQVLKNGKGQVQAAECALGGPGSKAGLVKPEVGKGHQKPRSRVQSDAEPPDVALRTEADRGTDGWQVVGNLKTKKEECILFLKNQQPSI